MSAGHTPGPWVIFDLHDASRLNVRGPSEEFVADCADGFYSDETGDWVMAEESLPNARLIAAAPDLLEAARMAVEIIKDSYGEDQIANGDDQACNLLMAAIARATGEREEGK